MLGSRQKGPSGYVHTEYMCVLHVSDLHMNEYVHGVYIVCTCLSACVCMLCVHVYIPVCVPVYLYMYICMWCLHACVRK